MNIRQSISPLRRLLPYSGLCSTLTIGLATLASPALAHHAMDGNIPRTVMEGFLSGLAHPLIGVDHIVFIIAIGLLATTRKQGLWLPITFVITAMLGTGMHLQGFSLPGNELLVASSILVFGLLLAREISLNTIAILGLSAFAGLCHGYAYGESIIGAQTTALVAYLAGFSLIQLLISTVTFWLAKRLTGSQNLDPISMGKLRSAGLVICGTSIAILMPQIVAILMPTPGV